MLRPFVFLIHRSAWNRSSPKFISRIVHRMPAREREDGFCGPSSHQNGDYMLWWCIKIRGLE
jgi:hypothetical protein